MNRCYKVYHLFLVPSDGGYRPLGIKGSACFETLERYPPIDIYTFPTPTFEHSDSSVWLDKVVPLLYLQVQDDTGRVHNETSITAKLQHLPDQHIYRLTIDHKK
ncbi:hypothetical protein PPL_10480 [Heterostelium album PN500]|uniref:Uncharacterized protein n=1 Tax=Heterostelium pallidum (strain ATCC 26659 / Pp 5 / PN500) TaxID=670386 RepID=D3BR76_HETP5|nr:hypothetical protein PPL_10480 [Heterostelium album PN500]EFA75908.1 hypothetical protein PPL_10480 [Heterostelium album PN500]|eukprot:XP_020428042.1 hypothetical protein PPL_10480 [Heterostelium album PN500]